MSKNHLGLVGLIFTFSTLLTGCSDFFQQEKTIRELREELNQKRIEAKARIDYFEDQAAIYRGCKWLIDICPADVTVTGEEAVAHGFSGATSVHRWMALFSKLFIVSLCLIAITWGCFLAYREVIRDELEELKREQENHNKSTAYWPAQLADLQKRKASLKEQIYALKYEAHYYSSLLPAMRKRAAKLGDEISAAEEQLERTQKGIATLVNGGLDGRP